MKSTNEKLFAKVNRVVENDNCAGCGLCASLFSGISMRLSNDGFMRPEVHADLENSNSDDAPAQFDRVCPGRSVTAPENGHADAVHEVFGRHMGVWEGWSTDPEIRRAGSSGGVLTAVSTFVREKTNKPAQMVAMDKVRPTRTIPVTIVTREEALSGAGSRYAPVAAASMVTDDVSSVTAKPCEISGLRAAQGGSPKVPLFLSFFCAGTPSQFATNQLVEGLDHKIEMVSATRYRGDGWPGQFVVKSSDGRKSYRSYEESWGEVLGKRLQSRCKICVDGTGESADIAVGDYWDADESGYPIFDDGEGKSVVIARTARGLQTLKECADAGVIELRPISLESVAKIQPLQVKRRVTLPGRLLGRRLVFQRVPKYRGYVLWPFLIHQFSANARATAGTVSRRLKRARKNV